MDASLSFFLRRESILGIGLLVVFLFHRAQRDNYFFHFVVISAHAGSRKVAFMFNPSPEISLVILVTVCVTILMMLVRRI